MRFLDRGEAGQRLAERMTAFADRFAAFPTSKGAVRLPLDGPLPEALIGEVVAWRVQTAARPPKRARDGARA